MQIHNVIQGSQEWHELRARYFTASEAPAMLGTSKHKSRSQLLKEKATGIGEDITAEKQALFDRGHDAEAADRPLAEEDIGEELFPATATAEVDGIHLLASFDGITMGEDLSYECKLWNEKLAAYLRDHNDVPETHWPQLEHQCLVSGAERVYFSVSSGSRDKRQTLLYQSRPERRAQVLAGWRQFAADLATYQHIEEAAAPTVAPIEDLPALLVSVEGRVTQTNLTAWQSVVVQRIQAIKTDLQSDEDFAVADKTVKFLEDGEKKLELVKSQALAQTASIDELFRTIDALKAEMKAKRLTLDKLVKARKESIRVEIATTAAQELRDHIDATRRRTQGYLPAVIADFAGAMKNKRTIAGLREAVSVELARAKMEATRIADGIEANLIALPTLSEGYTLFPDIAQLVLKPADDFAAVVSLRVADHKAKLEQERERIRQEEAAKAAADLAKQNAEATANNQTQFDPACVQDSPKSETQTPLSSAGETQSKPAMRVIDKADVIRRQINTALDGMNVWQLTDVLAFIQAQQFNQKQEKAA